MNTSNINIFSFFSGAGFLDLGFEKSGYTTSFVNEIHEPFLNAYKYSRQKLNIPEPKFGYHNDTIENFLDGPMAQELQENIEATKKQNKSK